MNCFPWKVARWAAALLAGWCLARAAIADSISNVPPGGALVARTQPGWCPLDFTAAVARAADAIRARPSVTNGLSLFEMTVTPGLHAPGQTHIQFSFQSSQPGSLPVFHYQNVRLTETGDVVLATTTLEACPVRPAPAGAGRPEAARPTGSATNALQARPALGQALSDNGVYGRDFKVPESQWDPETQPLPVNLGAFVERAQTRLTPLAAGNLPPLSAVELVSYVPLPGLLAQGMPVEAHRHHWLICLRFGDAVTPYDACFLLDGREYGGKEGP